MAEKSALRLIPGRDALLAYNPQPYPAGTYVEYQTLIYKALVNTSATFIGTEWELIGDLREVRVNYIQDRNSLTGNTVTSGNTGIHIPILDNTNVLVLNASADPQVGSNKFARYNYNKGSAKWLLLQVSTGSTGSNVSDYNLLSNKPPIISGITAVAGVGLTGGIVGSGSVPPTRVTFTIAHADTSSQPSLTPTGYTYIQGLKVDTFGHVTGATTSLWVHPDTSNQPSISNTGTTYIQSIGVDTDGHITSMASGVWVHPDTSSQGNSVNTGSTVIQSIYLDTDGHVIGINTATVSSGGGGVNFSVAGNSGGNKSMPNSGVLQITGGSNINTVSSLNGANVGVQLNVVPAGSNTYVQYNNNGILGATSAVAITGGTTLVANKVAVTSPVSGSTNDLIVTRNPVNGNLQTINLATLERAMVAQPANSVQFANVNGLFSGSSQFIFNPTSKALTLGTRLASTIGVNSFSIGTNNSASGTSSVTIGSSSRAAQNSLAGGSSVINLGVNSIAYGQSINITNASSGAVALGSGNFADGTGAVAIGLNTYASGSGSLAMGFGTASGQQIKAFNGAINISSNSSVPAPSRPAIGASASWSAILGGLNHSIDVTSTGAAIIGGYRTGTGSPGLNISGATYQDFVNVSNLAIWSTPAAGGTDDVLTWNAVSKKINKVAQSSLGGGGGSPAGGTGYVQLRSASGTFGAVASLVYATGTSTLTTTNLNLGGTPATGTVGGDNLLMRNNTTGNVEQITVPSLLSNVTASNGLSKVSANIVLGGALTGNTNISGAFRLQLSNTGGFLVGFTSGATASSSLAVGSNPITTSANNIAMGINVRSLGSASFAGGGINTIGWQVISSGNGSFNYSLGSGNPGKGATAQGSAILGGSDGYVASVNSVVLGGNSNYINSTTSTYSSIIGGSGNAINNTQGAGGNSGIHNGANGLIDGAVNSTVLGGSSNQITGASTSNSSIIGGLANKIQNGVARSAIIGGLSITLTGGSQSDNVVVPNLMLWNAPPAGAVGQSVLTYNSQTKKVSGVAQSSLSNASNGLTKNGFNNYTTLGGTLTGNTIVNLNNFGITFGSRNAGTVGTNSIVLGQNGLASGSSSVVMGQGGTASSNSLAFSGSAFGPQSIALLATTQSTATASFAAIGGVTKGQSSFAVGGSAVATGFSSMAFGFQANANASNAVCLGGVNSTQFQGLASGVMSFAFGNALASGAGSVAFGAGTGVIGDYTAKAIGQNSVAFNRGIATGPNSFAATVGQAVGGTSTAFSSGIATGASTVSLGTVFLRDINFTTASFNSKAYGNYSFATNGGRANGDHAIAMGASGDASSFDALTGSTASGVGAFAVMGASASGRHSIGLGYWAYAGAQYSGVFGGSYNTVNAGSTGSVILGGNSINLGATNYSYHAITSNVAIFTTPTTSVSTDNVLAWNSTDKKVKLGTISSTSDIRLKTDFTPITNAVDKISSLEAYEYTNNDVVEPMKGIKNYGLTAQEVEKVFPHVVKDNYVWNEETYKTVDYRHLVPVLFAAIKELNDKIKDLESKLK